MGNTTTHTQYTTSNTSSAPHPSTPHDPNPTAPSNNSHAPNLSPPHEKPSPNSHAPNTPTPTTSPTATTDTSNATSPPTPPSSTCSAIPSTPSPQTTPTPSPLMVPPSCAQAPTSQAPSGVGMWMWCCVGCVRFGCEGLVVFWGGCVVFWCSFWVGFWLSESLRGVFTPARNGRLQSISRTACFKALTRFAIAPIVPDSPPCRTYRITGAFETHHTLQRSPHNFTCFCQSHPKTCHESHAVGV
jgi:hypothetical protein